MAHGPDVHVRELAIVVSRATRAAQNQGLVLLQDEGLVLKVGSTGLKAPKAAIFH